VSGRLGRGGQGVEVGAAGGDLIQRQVVPGEGGGAVGVAFADDPPPLQGTLVAAAGPLRVERDGLLGDGVDELAGGHRRRHRQQSGHDRVGVLPRQAGGPGREHPRPRLVQLAGAHCGEHRW